MGRVYDELVGGLRDWLGTQPLFFVATAPTDPAGRVNVSSKGGAGTFRVLGPTTVAYLDLIGSGIETVAHLRENGRIVLMFCAFAGPPKIVRLHGRGRVVPSEAPEFAPLLETFAPSDEVRALARSVVLVEVERIADSCGFVVPRMEYAGERERHGDGWKDAYLAANNAVSIDGLPGLDGDQQVGNGMTTACPGSGDAP